MENNQAQVEKLQHRIDELKANIAKYGETLDELDAQILELNQAIAEATKLRNEENSSNELKVKDAQEAQTALTQAVTVLQEFYAKAGEATALVQKSQSKSVAGQPAIFDSPYTGTTLNYFNRFFKVFLVCQYSECFGCCDCCG